MNRLTPDRETAIRARQFFGAAKRVIMELLYEIDELRADIYSLQHGFEDDVEDEQEYHDEKDPHDDLHEPVYQKFQETQTERDKLKTILKLDVKNDAVKKFMSKSGEK